MVALVVMVAGCGGAAATSGPTSIPATVPPAASQRSAAEVEASVSDGLRGECADKKSAPDWCAWINMKNKRPDVLLDSDGTTILVSLGKVPDTAAGKKMGATLCADIAAAHYDTNGVDLGYNIVVVGGAANKVLASCHPMS